MLLGPICESMLRLAHASLNPKPNLDFDPRRQCRSANNLNGLNRTQLGNTIWRAPLVWLALNLLRFVLIGAFKPLFWLTLHLTWCAGLTPDPHHSTEFCFSVALASC